MAVDLHTAQIQGFFDGPVDHLFALPLLADHVGARVDRSELTIVSPDAGPRPGRRALDATPSAAPLAIIHKRRDPDVANEVKVHEVVGDVEGRTCVLRRRHDRHRRHDHARRPTRCSTNGAADVIVAATHAVLSGPAVDRLKNSRISEVVVTDTLPIPSEQRFDKLTVLSIAPLLARAIREVFDDGSVTSLFDGQRLTRGPEELVWGGHRGRRILIRRCPGEGADRAAHGSGRLRDRRGRRTASLVAGRAAAATHCTTRLSDLPRSTPCPRSASPPSRAPSSARARRAGPAGRTRSPPSSTATAPTPRHVSLPGTS